MAFEPADSISGGDRIHKKKGQKRSATDEIGVVRVDHVRQRLGGAAPASRT